MEAEDNDQESELIFDEDLSNVFQTEVENVESETVVVTDGDGVQGKVIFRVIQMPFFKRFISSLDFITQQLLALRT